MTTLSGFYFDQFAINFLIQFMLALAMTLYLLRAPRRTGIISISILFWASITLYSGTSFLSATAVWSRQFYAQLLQPIALTTLLVAALQFAYDFPQLPDDPFAPARQREKPIVLFTFTLAIFIAIGWAIYQFTQLQPNGNPQTFTQVMDSWLAFGFSWTALTFLRRVYILSHHHHPQQAWWQHLQYPTQPTARTLYLFFLTSLFGIVITTVMALSVLDAIPGWWRDFPPTIGLLLTLSLISVVYLSSTTEKTTFTIRLVGVSLLTMFLILGVVSLIITPIYAANIQPAPDTIPLQTLQFIPQPNGTYTVTATETDLDFEWGERFNTSTYTLPFEFPFYQQSWSTITLPHTGILAFGDWSATRYAYNYQPAITAVQYEAPPPTKTFIKRGDDRVTITWQFTNPFADAVQLVLYENGRFDLNYQRLSHAPIQRIGIQSGDGGTDFTPFDLTANYNQTPINADGLLIDYPIHYRQALHRLVQPLVYILISVTLLITLGFPLFFRHVLVQPLNNLVAGVKAVQQGDLQVQVPVQTPDEIGFVTDAFNQMVQSIYKADQHLEAQVAARTQELAESEQRFRDLAEATYEAIIIHHQAHIVDANEAAIILFDYANQNLIGQPIEQILTPPARQQIQNAMPEATYEVEGISQTGAIIPLEIRTNIIPYQHQTAQVIVARDLRERKQIEQQRQHLGALEERERIGRELHDDLGQVMGYFNVQIQAALARLQRAQIEQVQTILTELNKISQEAHHNVRQYILGIRTGDTNSDFWVALDNIINQFQNRYTVNVELTVTAELEKDLQVTAKAEAQLLRIIQEGLTNIHKHAQASQAHLIFMRAGDEVQLILKDNGRGFDTHHQAESGHFGLQIMQERAESVNGRLHISATPNQGTQLQVSLPRRRLATLPDTPPTSDSYPWRVLLVDDHPLFIEGLNNMLTSYGVNVVGTCTNGRDAEAAIPQLTPDLVIMDIHMPHQDGIETTKHIKEKHPDIKIVMLTSAADDALLFKALQNGASGYLLKSVPAPQMLTKLTAVMQGETALSADLAAQTLTTLAQEAVDGNNTPDPSLYQLTPRQREVLECVAQGMNNQQIADQLFISKSTVKYHLKQIMEQLQLQSRNQLIRYMIENS